jgi:hypothetical protein
MHHAAQRPVTSAGPCFLLLGTRLFLVGAALALVSACVSLTGPDNECHGGMCTHDSQSMAHLAAVARAADRHQECAVDADCTHASDAMVCRCGSSAAGCGVAVAVAEQDAFALALERERRGFCADAAENCQTGGGQCAPRTPVCTAGRCTLVLTVSADAGP